MDKPMLVPLLLISFDIDGTMTFGDPPGPVPVSFVQAAIDAGHVVGCASDRTRSAQLALWSEHGAAIQFAEHKHQLTALRERFPAAVRFIHVGDTHVDERYATAAGFEFWHVDEAAAFLALDWVGSSHLDPAPHASDTQQDVKH
jgi:hypothetical protein